MTYETMQEFKTTQKDRVKALRELKATAKGTGIEAAHRYFLINRAKQVYRNSHIAYCQLNGTPYERIETKVAENNAPDWKFINNLMEENEHLMGIRCCNLLERKTLTKG